MKNIWSLVLLLIFMNTLCIYCLKRKMIRVDRLESCYQAENVPFKIHYLHLYTLGQMEYSVSASGEFFEVIHARDAEVSIDFTKCRSRELLDSCEKLTAIKPPSICSLIELKEMGIRDTLDKIQPPLHCPLRKTNYTVKDLQYTVEKFTLFPLGNYYWKVKANVFYKKRLIASICLEVQSYEIRG